MSIKISDILRSLLIYLEQGNDNEQEIEQYFDFLYVSMQSDKVINRIILVILKKCLTHNNIKGAQICLNFWKEAITPKLNMGTISFTKNECSDKDAVILETTDELQIEDDVRPTPLKEVNAVVEIFYISEADDDILKFVKKITTETFELLIKHIISHKNISQTSMVCVKIGRIYDLRMVYTNPLPIVQNLRKSALEEQNYFVNAYLYNLEKTFSFNIPKQKWIKNFENIYTLDKLNKSKKPLPTKKMLDMKSKWLILDSNILGFEERKTVTFEEFYESEKKALSKLDEELQHYIHSLYVSNFNKINNDFELLLEDIIKYFDNENLLFDSNNEVRRSMTSLSIEAKKLLLSQFVNEKGRNEFLDEFFPKEKIFLNRTYGPTNSFSDYINEFETFYDDNNPIRQENKLSTIYSEHMLSCVLYDNEDGFDGAYLKTYDWFTGVCEKCVSKIPFRHWAVREPHYWGGWRGCYCSWDCVLDDLKNSKHFNITQMLVDYFSTLILTFGIQDRNEKNYEIIRTSKKQGIFIEEKSERTNIVNVDISSQKNLNFYVVTDPSNNSDEVAYFQFDTKYPKLIIKDILVIDRYQRIGVGFLILEYIINFAVDYDFEEIELTVEIDNEPAINLFKKLKFEIKSTKNNQHLMTLKF